MGRYSFPASNQCSLYGANHCQGVWTGQVAAAQTTPGMYLKAVDANGISGQSATFEVLPLNDLFVIMTDTPDPVTLAQTLNYSIVVSNSGPNAASGVIL